MLERANESCGDSRPAVSAGRSPADWRKNYPAARNNLLSPDNKISQSILRPVLNIEREHMDRS